MHDTRDTFARRLNQLHERSGSTLDRSAARLGISRRTLAYWLAGEREPDEAAQTAALATLSQPDIGQPLPPDPATPAPAPRPKVHAPADTVDKPDALARIQALEVTVADLLARLARLETQCSEFLAQSAQSAQDSSLQAGAQSARPAVAPSRIGSVTFGSRIVRDPDAQA